MLVCNVNMAARDVLC